MSAHNKPLLCLAHLRWDFVFQRPQHVISRIGASRSTFYYEEPRFTQSASVPCLDVRREGSVTIATPAIPSHTPPEAVGEIKRALFDDFYQKLAADGAPVLWYYTPLALEFTAHIRGLCVYDCMDELSLFKDAPADTVTWEKQLLERAAVVFTGGRSLYFAKRRVHSNVHCFPSAVDERHFAPSGRSEPQLLQGLRSPRMLFHGVIDERFDTAFVVDLAGLLPEWELVFVGPVVKIDPATLPQSPNIHYPGMRSYDELPAFLEHADVTLLPFALNDATRFISPTKTLEYLAARKPVISTPIADVVDPYGTDGLVHIAHSAAEAAAHARDALARPLSQWWHRSVGNVLERSSWDATVRAMETILAASEVQTLENAG